MPQIPITSEVCHYIIAGMGIAVFALGTTILGMAWYVLSLQKRNDVMQAHLNEANDGITNLLTGVLRRKNNDAD